MRRASRSMLVVVMAACLFGASATIASAFPSENVLCANSSCHAAGAGATVAASLVSTSATTATYNVAMTGSAGSAWAVFDGSNRVTGATTAAGPFTVDLGKTYDVFAVDAASSNYVKTSVSPAAPSVEPTASLDETIPPVTTSDAVTSYVGTATVKLTATDAAGQGVAYIYYSIDGARVHLFTVGMIPQTSVIIAAPAMGTATHTIAFWSQDKAGNVEARNTVTLTVAAPSITYVPFSGNSRYDTTVLASKAAFPDGAESVVIATGVNWPDALGGASLAGALDGPILLTQPDAVPSSIMDEITRLGAKKAVIIGGSSAVSAAVENALKNKLGSGNVERIAGTSRYDTANKVAARVIEEAGIEFPGNAFVATGANFPDSLAASPIAASGMRPIYLVPSTATGAPALPTAIKKVVILGGTSAMNAKVESSLRAKLGSANVERLAGTNRYDTAAKIATYGVDKAGLRWDGVAVTTGVNFPDALGGGVLQGVEGSVMLLTDPNTLSTPTRTALDNNRDTIDTPRYFGGLNAVSQNVRNAITTLLK